MRVVRFSQGLFAVASASVALWGLAYGEFAPGGPSLPTWAPGREIWTYGFALLVLAASAGLCFSRTASTSILTIAVYLAAWAVICIPEIVSKPLSIDAWYGFCEATTSLVGAWTLYAILRWQSQGSWTSVVGERTVHAARVLLGLICVFYGWSHFVYADYTASMVPSWLPSRLGFAYFTGLGHIAAGLALMFGTLPRLAANLEALMMSLFGLLVWVPSFFSRPRPTWATPPENQWSELVVTLALAASAWMVATSLRDRPWTAFSRKRLRS